MIKRAKVTYSSLRKTLEKQTKAIEDQVKKQIKANEYDVKQLVDLMNLLTTILISKKIAYYIKKKIMKLLKKGLLNLTIQKKRVNPDNLIYK